MPRELKLPTLGENIEGGDVVKILVRPGDVIATDQPILELETGKATVEVPSPDAGRVAALLVKAGDAVKIGQSILTLEETDAAPAAVKPPPAAPAAAAPTPPAAVPAPAAVPPTAPGAAPRPPVLERPTPAENAAPAAARVPVAAAPSVRKFAREIGVVLEEVVSRSAGGRITIEDVKRHARQASTGRKVAGHCALEAIPLPDFSRWGLIQKETMNRVRVTAAEHLSRAWATIPHVTQHDLADLTKLEALRERFADRVKAAGGKLTVTAILLKIVAAALKVFPKFNASVDMAGREVVFKKYYNLGVAVDTERGLIVPVLRDADKKNIVQIAIELGEIAKKAREGRVSPDDLQGGTFTVTNIGGIGGLFFTPIINAPEVAILGVGRSQLQPACGKKDEMCRPRPMLPLSLSYDHRLIDGADGARFMRWLVEAIEEPMLISLEG